MVAIKMKTEETLFRYCRSSLLLRNNNTNTACIFNIINNHEQSLINVTQETTIPKEKQKFRR